MDKKTYFQKNLLKSKINEISIKLKDKEILFNDLTHKKNSMCNLHIDLNNIDNTLLKLESEKLNCKKTISALTTTISDIKNKIKEYPDTIIENIKKENNILYDEIERIEIERIETLCIYQEELKKGYIDKECLLNNITLYKEQISYHNDYIDNLQIELHKSRKNTIEQLKENKIKKNNLNNELKNYNETIINFKNKINELKQTNNELEKFKKLLIDSEYNMEITNTELDNYYTKFNINKQLTINEKIDLIDNFIDGNINDINYMNKKMNKTETLNNTIINETKKDNSINNFKIITYKDNYKIAKEKKKNLQLELDKLLEKYNNYENIVIYSITNKFNDKIKELDYDIVRAKDRFEIIKFRLKNEEEKNKIISEESINTIKIELSNNENRIIKVSNQIKELIKNKECYQKITLELKQLSIEIQNYKNNIKHYETDLSSLN